jgi:hypothetical protein
VTSSDSHPLDPTEAHELLNAYLDGEVSDQERVVVEAGLEMDAGLRAELSAARHTRDLVRELPLLEMPPDLAARLARRSPIGAVARPRRRSRARALAVSAAASVAFWGAVATTGDVNAVVPDLAGVVGAHTATLLEVEHPEADASVMLTMPESFDRFDLVYASRGENGAHAMYTDGEHDISVFEQHGRVDWDLVPVLGRRFEVDGNRAWVATIEGQSVMLLERKGMVYTVVASAQPEMDSMASAMPGDDESWVDQVRRASRRSTEFFGFGS